MKKRILASLMSLCLLVGLLPTAAFAVEPGDSVPTVPVAEETTEQAGAVDTEEITEDEADAPAQPTNTPETATADTEGGKTVPGWVDENDGHPKDDPVPVANSTATENTFAVGDITYEVTGDNTVSVTKKSDGTLYSGDITIPSTVSYEDTTYSVTAIGKDAFRSCKDLGAVTVPSSVKTIGQTAFGYIGSPMDMGTNTFSITLNEGLETIGAEAFVGSRKLKNIHIPASVTTLGTGIFQNCTNLTTVTFAESSQLTAIPASCFYCNAPGSLSSITLPEGITSIGRGAFCGTKLTSIEIPGGVTEIPENAFYNTPLATVTGLDGVTKIGNSAFKNTCLTGEFTIPNTVTEIGSSAFNSTDFTKVVFEENSQLATLGASAFLGCGNLTEIAFPDTLTELPEKVLEGCSNLTSVTLPNGISAIPANAFKNCSSLGTIQIPASVTELDATAFSGCAKLENIDVSESASFVTEDGLLYNRDKTKLLRAFHYESTTYEIPDSVTTIAEGALVGTTITSITFPENSTRTAIDANMFKSCTNLTSVTLPAGLQAIGDSAFSGCTGLTEMVIPDGVTSIGDIAFSGCSNLASVTLPNTLTTLGTGAFHKTGLTSVDLPDNLEMISDQAFYACKSLVTVKFPEALKEIGDEAFYSTALSEIMIPQGTEVIGSGAFGGTKQVDKVIVPASVTKIGTSAFFLCEEAVYVMAPTSLSISGSGGKSIYSNNTVKISVTIYCPVEMAAQHKQMLRSNREATISSFTLSMPAAVSVAAGSSTTLEASVAPSDSQLTVESSDTSKATVSATEVADGISTISISALAAGETTITATLKVAGLEVLKDTCTVTVTAEGAVIPSVEEPVTNTDKITDTDDKKTAGEVAGSVASDETISRAAKDAADSLDNSSEKETLITQGKDELNPSVGQEVSLYTQTYLDIEATEVKKDNENVTSITLNITPKVQVVASTATNSAAIDIKTGNDDKDWNAVVVKDPELLTITTSSEITVQLPASFANKPVYVKHEASNGTYFYTAEANAAGEITFTSAHGFSPFTFSLTNEAVAEVNGIGYASFQDAVNAAGNDEVVKVLKSDANLTANVSGSSRTIKVQNGTTADSISVSLNGTTLTVAKDATVDYTYTRPSGGGGSSGSTRYTVSVEDVDNGSVKVSPTRASRGSTVTITIDPDEGYELDELTVTDKNGDKVKLTKKDDNKFTFKMPSSSVEIEVSFTKIEETPEPDPSTGFVDVPANAYYADAVEWAVSKGITSGTSATTFSPDMSCTRAQMVTFLWRAAGSPAPKSTANPFVDIQSGAYYYDAVLWAVEQGITSGTSATTFAPDTTVTRGQTVTFLYRAAGSPAVTGSSFTDVADDAYYADAVAWAVSENITAGTGNGLFAPDTACTRAQIVTFLYRDAHKI